MESDRKDAVDAIVNSMLPYLDAELISTLKASCYVALNDYRLEKEETSLALYEGRENELYIKKFIIAKRVLGCSERTLHGYYYDISNALAEIGKNIAEITTDDLIFFLARYEINNKVRKTTVNNKRLRLSTFFAWATESGVIMRNPMLSIKKIKGEKLKKKSFTEMEIEKIRHACENEKEKCIVEILLSTGCRVSELVLLKPDLISDGKAIILGKGNKERTVFFNAKALLSIEEYMKLRKDKNPYLFPKMKGVRETTEYRKQKNKNYDIGDPEFYEDDGTTDKSTIEQILRRVGRRAGVEKCHPHRFRRTCATMALKRGMSLFQVSRMLGHESVSTTQIYLDISDDVLEQEHRKFIT